MSSRLSPVRTAHGSSTTLVYRRRHPERMVLYRLVQQHLASWLAARREADPDGVPIPRHVERELRGYLERGILVHLGEPITPPARAPRARDPPRTRRRVQLRVRSVPVVGLDRRSVRAELPLRSDPELTNHPSALLLLRRGCSVLRHAARPADRRAPLPQRPAAPAGTRWAVLAMVLPLGRCFVQELITAEAPHSGRSVHIGKDDPWPAESTPTSATSCT